MNTNVHGKRNTARPASVSSLAPRFTGSTLKGKKSRVSLALAVSLWIATGGTPWTEAAEAATKNEYYMSGGVMHNTGTTTETFSLAGVTAEIDYASVPIMTITAEENAENPIDWSLTDNNTYYPAWIYTVPSFSRTEGYTLSVDGRNATFTGITNIRAGVSKDEANSNTLNIKNLKLDAYSWQSELTLIGGEGDRGTTGNRVTITGSTIGEFYNVNIYGGYAGVNTIFNNGINATGNIVTIANSALLGVSTIIYGGYVPGDDGSTTGNIVNLYGTVQSPYLKVIGGNKANTGNALHLGGTADGQTVNDIPFAPWTYGSTNSIAKVENFEKIVLHQVKWDTSTPALTTYYLTNFGGVLDISDMSFANDTAVGTMNLLQGSTGNFSTLALTYKSGDSTATTSLGGDNPTSCVVRQGTATEESAATNGIKLALRANEHSVSIADSSKVRYTIGNYVTGVTLGEIAWDTSTAARTLTTEEQALYTFDANTAIDASGLTFTDISLISGDPLNDATKQSMTLLSGAKGAENVLPANITQPSAGKGTIAVDYTNDQNINFTATASGEVSVGTDKVDYTINNVTLSGVNLANWNGTTSAVPEGWTAKTDGVSVTGDGFTAPSITTGNSVDILTTGMNGFFSNANISDAIKFKDYGEVSNTDKGVTLIGNESKGVKANTDGKNLIYERDFTVNNITLGSIAWNAGGTVRDGSAYDFSANSLSLGWDNVKDFALTFADEAAYKSLAKDKTMTLISNATGIKGASTGANPTFDYTIANDATLNTKVWGQVKIETDTLTYKIDEVDIESVDLAGWDGTKEVFAVPDGWLKRNLGREYVSVTAEGFTAPSIDAGSSREIITTNTEGFFNDNQITGALKYKAAASSSDTANGVTLTGAESKGVKASNGGKNLVYARSNFEVSGISLGNMTWGTAREATTRYDFDHVADANISAANLKFSNPESIAKDATTTLLSGATNLDWGTDIAHTQDFTKTVNGATLSATLSGNVIRSTAWQIGYMATSMTLDSVNLANWNGTTGSVPTGWTANLGANSITAAGFDASSIGAGASKDILTTTTNNFFNDNQITGAMKYATTTSSDTENGVTLTGSESKGVKASADGKSLVYTRSEFNVSGISLGNMTWGTAREASTSCNFQNVADANISVAKLEFSNPEDIAKDTTTTLLSSATHLAAGDNIAHTQNFTKTVNGTTLSATLSGNVIRTTAGTLGYKATDTALNKATLGGFAWGAEADSIPEGWTVSAATTIDATNFKYEGTADTAVAARDIATILNAPGLTTDSPVTGGRNKTVPIDYTNGESHINFKATATGDVEAAENMVQYVVKSVALSNVNLGDWNGTASGVPQNWTGSQVAVSTGNFNVPTKLAVGESIDILTTSTANFFGTVSGDRKYRSETFENSEAGVTLSGHNFGGVKVENYGEAANAKLTYYAETMDTTAITLGEMTWGVSRDGNGAGYNYASAAIDASGLKFANWKPEETAANSSTILLLANDTLTDFTAVSKNYSYSVAPTSGVTVDGALNGSVSKSGNNIVYTATENKASKLTFGTVSWMKEGALIDHAATLTNVSFEGAAVDTTNIKFQNLQTAASEDKMTLVSSFGSSIGTVTGTEFSVGKGKGEGHAYLESNDLKYVVTQGVNFDPKGDDNAINEAGDPVGGEIASDVIGGVAQNTGVAKDNTMEVLAGSDVSGSVTAAISVNGASEKNEAQVTDAHVSGSVTGAAVNGSGTAADNSVIVQNTNVGDVQTHTGDVIGAKTDSGLATGNIANVTGGKVEGSVIGAQSTSGTVSTGNEAKVSGANVGGNVYGGVSTDGEANANKAELSGGAVVEGDVYGGKSENKTAAANNVKIENATVEGDVYGGKSKTASNNNEVTFNGGTDGTVNNLIGGGCETATGNTVTVENGTVKESVYGGKADKDALENHVILSGGTVKQAVYGGWSDSISGKTQNNSVLLYGEADVHTANIFGGNREATGNTLTIGLSSGNTNTPWTGGEQTVKQTVKNISNFENISFAVVPWSESKAAVTITDGTASDLSMSKVNATKVHFTNVNSLKQSDSMTLLDQSRAAKKATTVEEKSEFTIGSGVQGKGYLSLDKENGNVVYTVGEMGASEQSHNTVMGATVGMAALSAGNDFIGSATEGLSLASNVGADGVSSFAQMGGGSMRQETGSHVDTHTWNAILALGHQNKKERGTMEYGAFFEYGTGNYSTFNGDERGDGSTKYTGGGLLAKWTNDHGFYVEGSLRAGTVHDDARNVLRDEVTRMPYSYETDAPYIGFHLGVGKEIAFDDIHSLDVYGKYFYNRRNGVSFDAGGHYDLDAVTSQVVRVGARYTVKQDKWNFYGGVAYEHELDGKASGTVDGFAIRGADTSGGSFRGEIGATMKPGDNSPWSLDLNVSGFAGKKQGFTGGVSVAFMF